jgi:hypothetical protein
MPNLVLPNIPHPTGIPSVSNRNPLGIRLAALLRPTSTLNMPVQAVRGWRIAYD